MNSIRRIPRLGAALAVLLFAGIDVPGVAAATRQIPTHEDIWLMKRIGPPQVSPDGRWIVVQVAEPAYDENSQLSDLWLVDTSARNFTRRLTSTRRPETGVIWSPDSRRIVFSAQRDTDDVPQLYSLDLAAGGEAQRLTSLSGGARAPVFSHDGRQIAFVALMYPHAADEEANKAQLAAHRARKSSARIYDGFPIRNWDHWIDERQVRIFVLALDDDGQPSGAPRDLLAGTKLAAKPGFAGRQTASHSAFVSRPSSSWTTTCSSTLRPAPPHSTGMLIAFRRASSTAARISASRSGVSRPSRSHSSSYAISVVVRLAARRLSSSSSGV